MSIGSSTGSPHAEESMSRWFSQCAAVALALLLGGTAAWAQATASINGTARDSSGAVLPGVTITATQTDTGLVRTTVSNETGAFSLVNLPLGPYRLEGA